jgi:hypothetical protein
MRLEHARTLQCYGMALLQQKTLEEASYQQGVGYLHQARLVFTECHPPAQILDRGKHFHLFPWFLSLINPSYYSSYYYAKYRAKYRAWYRAAKYRASCYAYYYSS